MNIMNTTKFLHVSSVALLALSIFLLIIGEIVIGLAIVIVASIMYLAYLRKEFGYTLFKIFIEHKIKRLLALIVSLLLAIFIAGLFLKFSGYPIIDTFEMLVYGGFIQGFGKTVSDMSPFILTGLAVTIAYKAGLFNIGVQGQYLIGVLVTVWLGSNTFFVNTSPTLALCIIALISMIFAGAYNYIPAILKVKRGIHEVITTMMLANIMSYMSIYFVKLLGGDPATSSHPYSSNEINQTLWFTSLNKYIDNVDFHIHTDIIVAVCIVFLIHFIINYTTFGLNLRAFGNNKHTAECQGVNPSTMITIMMFTSGMLAGLGGYVHILSQEHRMFVSATGGAYGWDGMAIALLANNNPIAILFTAFLWSGLDTGQQYLIRKSETPGSIIDIIKGLILLFVVSHHLSELILEKIKLAIIYVKNLVSKNEQTANPNDV